MASFVFSGDLGVPRLGAEPAVGLGPLMCYEDRSCDTNSCTLQTAAARCEALWGLIPRLATA